MMQNFFKAQRLASIHRQSLALRTFYYPGQHHVHLNQEPHVLAKRIIRMCGDRLRESDPHRWEGVPITFKTHWNNENDEFDVKTCILIHDAVEREFSIDIDDKKQLLVSVQDVFHFIMSMHAAM
jgi:hypothetical protein